jgi:hypothetical protein
MNDSKDNPISEGELKSFINEFDSKIKGYMLSLKQKSSDEILNGSAQKAQDLLNKIIKFEDGVKNLTEAHLKFLELLSDNNSKVEKKSFENISFKGIDSPGTEESDQLVEHDQKEKNGGSSKKYRMPFLKALIYLGGNAREDDVLEFVHKEVKKNLTEEELSINGDGKTKIWIRNLRKDSEVMVSEGLLNRDPEENSYEITQTGIDYLAKHDE